MPILRPNPQDHVSREADTLPITQQVAYEQVDPARFAANAVPPNMRAGNPINGQAHTGPHGPAQGGPFMGMAGGGRGGRQPRQRGQSQPPPWWFGWIILPVLLTGIGVLFGYLTLPSWLTLATGWTGAVAVSRKRFRFVPSTRDIVAGRGVLVAFAIAIVVACAGLFSSPMWRTSGQPAVASLTGSVLQAVSNRSATPVDQDAADAETAKSKRSKTKKSDSEAAADPEPADSEPAER